MSGAEPKEESEKFNNCINVPNQRTVELLNEIEELKEENKKLKEEVRGMKEKTEKIDKIDDLTEETSFELHEWMQDEVTDLKLSFKELMKHTLEIYQRLLEKGISMAKGRSTAERSRLKIEVQKLDDLREKIYTETKKKNQESIRTIKNHLGTPKEAMADNEADCVEKTERAEIVVEEWISDEQRTLLDIKDEVQKIGKLCEKVSIDDIVKMTGLIPEIGKACEKISRDETAGIEEKEEEKRQLEENEEKLKTNQKLIQPFLGKKRGNSEEYLSITYNERTGYYQDAYTHRSNPPLNRTSSWKLDGVERHGVQATFEGNCLVITDIHNSGFECKYELCENGIHRNGCVFLRCK